MRGQWRAAQYRQPASHEHLLLEQPRNLVGSVSRDVHARRGDHDMALVHEPALRLATALSSPAGRPGCPDDWPTCAMAAGRVDDANVSRSALLTASSPDEARRVASAEQPGQTDAPERALGSSRRGHPIEHGAMQRDSRGIGAWRRSRKGHASVWCRLSESNGRPSAYKAGALPTELSRRVRAAVQSAAAV